ncbi:hypothetical protein L1887_55545 [Cichorium endivia]|nr:hypothetical protein L1887_55545 [Cichorium endivia]
MPFPSMRLSSLGSACNDAVNSGYRECKRYLTVHATYHSLRLDHVLKPSAKRRMGKSTTHIASHASLLSTVTVLHASSCRYTTPFLQYSAAEALRKRLRTSCSSFRGRPTGCHPPRMLHTYYANSTTCMQEARHDDARK